MIRPILEYANPVWSPHTQRDIDKLEQVQRQSARFIMADFSRFSSVTNMHMYLNIPSLELRRQVSSILFFCTKLFTISLIYPLLIYFQHQSTQPKISSYLCKEQSIQQLKINKTMELTPS